MRRIMYIALLVFVILTLIACGDGSASQPSASAVKSSEAATLPAVVEADTPVSPIERTSNTDRPGSPTERAPDTNTSVPTVTPAPLCYNLPPVTLTYSTCLYASPNRSECIHPTTIPAGETVCVMGRNATRTHLRVVFGTGVGWAPVSFTDYNGKPDMLKALPIFTREPPACAEPITTQFGLNSTWTSGEEKEQRIAVVVDLFRSRYGDFPPSYLSLTVNGREVEKTRRQIVEQGQFSLKDVVFTLPAPIRKGDTVGYLLDTASDEPLTFIATIFSVPESCEWDTKGQ